MKEQVRTVRLIDVFLTTIELPDARLHLDRAVYGLNPANRRRVKRLSGEESEASSSRRVGGNQTGVRKVLMRWFCCSRSVGAGRCWLHCVRFFLSPAAHQLDGGRDQRLGTSINCQRLSRRRLHHIFRSDGLAMSVAWGRHGDTKTNYSDKISASIVKFHHISSRGDEVNLTDMPPKKKRERTIPSSKPSSLICCLSWTSHLYFITQIITE